MPKLYEACNGKLSVHFHRGQLKAWDSDKRVVAIIAGGRSGKTSFAPLWLHREMMRKGPGDYLVAAPNYPIIDKAAGPEVKALFENILHLGEMKAHPPKFTISDAGARKLWGAVPDRPSRILFGHADDPESIEAMSAKAAWLDEAGQGRFKLDSWEAVQQRVSLDEGRVLITSKPYNLGWMKQKIFDPWKAANGKHPDFDVINFNSAANPAFPIAEMNRARSQLPSWKYNMQYLGIFSRPAGLIYDSFDETVHKIKRFALPDHWPRYVGLDFGGTNTAAVFFAGELDFKHRPTGRFFAYREYRAGNITIAEHILALLEGEPRTPYCVGGSASEGQWRAEFSKGGIVPDAKVAGGWRRVQGLPVHGPSVTDVEVGIDRVYAAFRRGELLVFDDMEYLLEELLSYSREVDEDTGEPTEKIADKSSFHGLDSARYIIGYLKKDLGLATIKGSPDLRPGCPVVSPGVPAVAPGSVAPKDLGPSNSRKPRPMGGSLGGGMGGFR